MSPARRRWARCRSRGKADEPDELRRRLPRRGTPAAAAALAVAKERESWPRRAWLRPVAPARQALPGTRVAGEDRNAGRRRPRSPGRQMAGTETRTTAARLRPQATLLASEQEQQWRQVQRRRRMPSPPQRRRLAESRCPPATPAGAQREDAATGEGRPGVPRAPPGGRPLASRGRWRRPGPQRRARRPAGETAVPWSR